jgi:DNA helicase II / ATP-dependent DNA helicase PcrA
MNHFGPDLQIDDIGGAGRFGLASRIASSSRVSAAPTWISSGAKPMTGAADPIRALLDTASPTRAADDWGRFVDTVTSLRAGRSGWPAELACARLWYEPHLERLDEDVITRRADLIQLEQIASGYPSRERFLTELALDPPDATSDHSGAPHLDEDYLILSTIHSAKGQEWRSVFVLNVVDGCIPSDLGSGATAEIEEERRLL